MAHWGGGLSRQKQTKREIMPNFTPAYSCQMICVFGAWDMSMDKWRMLLIVDSVYIAAYDNAEDRIR